MAEMDYLDQKLRAAQIRLRLIKSALNCDERHLREKGYISGYGQRSIESTMEFIEKSKRREHDCMQLIGELEEKRRRCM